MAELVCRSCGGAVAEGATVCPHCGAADPVVISTPGGPDAVGRAPDAATQGPAPERSPGSRAKSAARAIGCVVLALIVLAIAIVVGLFDLVF